MARRSARTSAATRGQRARAVTLARLRKAPSSSPPGFFYRSSGVRREVSELRRSQRASDGVLERQGGALAPGGVESGSVQRRAQRVQAALVLCLIGRQQGRREPVQQHGGGSQEVYGIDGARLHGGDAGEADQAGCNAAPVVHALIEPEAFVKVAAGGREIGCAQ